MARILTDAEISPLVYKSRDFTCLKCGRGMGIHDKRCECGKRNPGYKEKKKMGKKRIVKAITAELVKAELEQIDKAAQWRTASSVLAGNDWAWDKDLDNDVLLVQWYADSPYPEERAAAAQIMARPEGQRWL